MPSTEQKAPTRKTAQVFLSYERVIASEVGTVIPKGYRQATPEEVALRYRQDASFRQNLYSKGHAWVSQKNIESSKYQEISEDGVFSKVDPLIFNSISPESRARYYPGSSPMAMYVHINNGECLWLDVRSNFRQSDKAVVAYVKDEHIAAAPKNGKAASPIPKQLVRNAEQVLSKLETGSLADKGELSAIRKLIEAAKRT